MTTPTHCERCGSTLLPADDAHRHPRCARCGTPHARSDLSVDKFPLTITIHSGKTGELLWSRTVTAEEARDLAKVEIPGYASTEHYPVRVEIVHADGTNEIGGMQ
jgi:hypothetical protein